MKALLSALLGLMLLTSLVGISYATPIVQPLQNAGGNSNGDNCAQQSPSNSNYNVTVACHGNAHVGGSPGDPHSCGVGARTGPDFSCCGAGQKADGTCCFDGITPHAPEVSDLQPDTEC